MPGRWRIRIEVRETTFVLRGWRAADLAREAGVKVTYSGAVQGWLGDRPRLGDVLALLDHRHISHVITDVDQPELWPTGGGDVA